MMALDTKGNVPDPRDPRARGEPHYFVKRISGGPECAACRKPWDDPIHTVRKRAA